MSLNSEFALICHVAKTPHTMMWYKYYITVSSDYVDCFNSYRLFDDTTTQMPDGDTLLILSLTVACDIVNILRFSVNT